MLLGLLFKGVDNGVLVAGWFVGEVVFKVSLCLAKSFLYNLIIQ